MAVAFEKKLEFALNGSVIQTLRDLGAQSIVVPTELRSDLSPNLATGADEVTTAWGTSTPTRLAIDLADYPATYVGAPTRGLRGPLPDSRMATAFDGAAQYMTVSGRVSAFTTRVLTWSPLTGVLSGLSLVILFKGGNAGEPLMCRSAALSTGDYGLFTDAFELAGDRAGTGITFANTSDANNWVMLIVSVSETTSKVWKNGVAVPLGGAVAKGGQFCPASSTQTLYIGRNVSGTDFFTGTIAMAAFLPQELSDADAASIYEATQWTDVTHDWLKNAETECTYGIPGDEPDDLVADPGTLSFGLNNSEANEAGLKGYYTPGHANAPVHWERGCPARLTFSYGGVDYTKFRGRVDSIDPETGEYGPRTCAVEVGDWFSEADRGSLSALGTETDLRMDEGVFQVIDDMPEKPAFIDVDQGIDTFPFVFDDAAQANPAPATEIARLAQSERGRWYQIGDTEGGGTLRGESRHSRAFVFSPSRTLDRDMLELRAPRMRDDIITKFRATVRPRKVGGATEILFSLDGIATHVGPGETRTIRGNYRDPNQQQASISGTDLVTPLVAGTDYVINSLEDGTGVDVNAQFTVEFEHAGIQGIWTFTNNGLGDGWIQPGYPRVRGKGLYRYSEVSAERENADLRVKYGERLVMMSLPYQSSPQNAQGFVDEELSRRGDELKLAKEVEFFANDSEDHLLTALMVEPGWRVEILNDLGAIDTDYFVQQVSYRLLEGHLWVTWGVAPADREAKFIFDDPIYGTFDGALGRLAHV